MPRVCLEYAYSMAKAPEDFDITTKRDKEMRKKKMMIRHYNIISIIMLATMLLAACGSGSGSDGIEDTPSTTSSEAPKEIQVTSNVYRRPEATRTTTYDNVASLQTEAHFKCTAYNAGTLTPYISTTTVDWIAGASRWGFNNGNDHYYWPASGNLDFFGYMPATLPSYIAADPALTYTADHNVTFTCSNLPMTNAGQGSSLKEFMFGMELAQNKDNAGTGVPLQFQHPFARIKLQLAASHPNVTINSITFRGIYNNGNYNHSASPKWSTTGDATNFVLSLTGNAAVFDDNPASETPIGDYYIMIPQDWAGVIEVNADCLFWGEKKNYPSLTTTVPTNWQPGYSYTYTFTISPDDLIVNISKFTEQW